MIEITERKNLTKAGLTELQKLIKNLNEKIAVDIAPVVSPIFSIRATHDNGYIYGDIHYYEWTATSGRWKIISGKIKFQTFDDAWEDYRIEHCERFDFPAAISALIEVVTAWDEAAKKKDYEVADFLRFCKEAD